MAQLTLTIPDALLTRVTAGICGLHGHRDTIGDAEGKQIANPETKAAFLKRIIMQKIKRDVLEWEGNEAQRAAMKTGETDILI
jgi:hypothetical protein